MLDRSRRPERREHDTGPSEAVHDIHRGQRVVLADAQREHPERDVARQRDLPYVSLLTRNTVAVSLDGLEGYEDYPGGELYSLRHVSWKRSGR